jgi:hypothetical protein
MEEAAGAISSRQIGDKPTNYQMLSYE